MAARGAWLKPFYDSLPRSLRHRWDYRMWANMPYPFRSSNDSELQRCYQETLKSGLIHRCKILFDVSAPDYRILNLFWNMALAKEWQISSEARFVFRSHNRYAQLQQWLNEKFLPYPQPAWSYRLWEIPQSSADLKMLCSLGRGESPRTRLSLSKQELRFFLDAPASLETLQSVCVWCAATAQGCANCTALLLARSWQDAGIRTNYSEMLHFIRNMAAWLSRQDIQIWQIYPLVKYLLQQKFYDSNFSFKGRTIQSLQRQADAWQLEQRRDLPLTASWAAFQLSDVLEDAEVIFDELITMGALVCESRNQHNCVDTYAPRCVKGKSAIVSMQSLDAKCRLTIEIAPASREIVQAQGVCNLPPSPQEWKLLQRYAAIKNLQIAI